MADTTYLSKVVEPFLRNWAGTKLGVVLEERKVVVGQDTEGNPIGFKFDGVSDDGKVGVCISASSSYKTGQMRKYFMEATLLNRVPEFDRRVMVFIQEHIWESFKNECDGLVDLHQVEALICNEIPDEMCIAIEEVYRKSASEVGDKSGPGRKSHGKRS